MGVGLMTKLANTYGKVWNTWLEGDVPLGGPVLMESLTSAGQVNQKILAARNSRFPTVNMTALRVRRKNIQIAPILPGAHQWEKNKDVQPKLVNVPSHKFGDCQLKSLEVDLLDESEFS
eukprot:TRINITY_DN14736_c0_g1_i1.p1 TRINITY_DN14736_c0_g1~~TRINITY_DN14736_c0_g1_i1.p1  ORF type:complete len:127 (-),score=41.69 TRINITY_DN14736_c0_g1_i1:37-393(-)